MSLVVSASSSTWQKKKGSLLSSATVVVDSFIGDSFDGLEYYLLFRNAGGDLVKSLKLSVHKVDGDVRDLVYAKYGNNIKIDVSTALNGGNFELTLTNNELFTVDYRIARLKLN